MKAMNGEKRWAIIALASVPLIMTLGNSMLIPILPVMEEKIDISKLQSSYIITVYSIVAIICIPIAGYLSDRFGRKNVIVPALIIAGIGGLVAGFASWKLDEPFVWIIIGRILQGIGASGAMPIVFPLIGDMFHKKEASATLGMIETSNTVGKVLSPILGAALTALIWFLPFMAIPLFCLISLLLIVFFIKKKEEDEEEITFSIYWKKVKETFQEHKKWLIAIFIIGAILMFILFGFLFYLSSLLEDSFDIKGVKKGLLLAIPLLALSIASYITGKKIENDVVKMKWIIFIGTIISGASVTVLSLERHFIYVIIIFFVCGAGIGIALPCLDALITNSLENNVLGAITSIYSAMRFIGVALGPPVIALLMKKTILSIVILFTFLAIVTAILSFVCIKPENRSV